MPVEARESPASEFATWRSFAVAGPLSNFAAAFVALVALPSWSCAAEAGLPFVAEPPWVGVLF